MLCHVMVTRAVNGRPRSYKLCACRLFLEHDTVIGRSINQAAGREEGQGGGKDIQPAAIEPGTLQLCGRHTIWSKL